jgi:predicted CoA-binding protein
MSIAIHHLCIMKKTVVIGASTNPDRYSNKAIRALVANGIETYALGLKSGEVAGVAITHSPPSTDGIDTVSLYVGPSNQEAWVDTILALNPNRILFNPGTENPELELFFKEKGIKTEHACTLVLLSTHQY